MKYNRIKEVLEKSQKSQRWLAKELGVSEVSVSNWVQNKKFLSMSNLFKISEILGCNPSELINDDPFKTTTNE